MSASLALAGVICAVAALPLLLSLPHDLILHNLVSPLAPDLAAFPKSALPTRTGYLAAGPATSAKLYYMYYEARATGPAVSLEGTPLILWLQGGPGCSSLIGNFYELGPWRISEKLALISNPGAWNSKYGVLFIDNPVGTGFSTADKDEDIPGRPARRCRAPVLWTASVLRPEPFIPEPPLLRGRRELCW